MSWFWIWLKSKLMILLSIELLSLECRLFFVWVVRKYLLVIWIVFRTKSKQLLIRFVHWILSVALDTRNCRIWTLINLLAHVSIFEAVIATVCLVSRFRCWRQFSELHATISILMALFKLVVFNKSFLYRRCYTLNFLLILLFILYLDSRTELAATYSYFIIFHRSKSILINFV